MSLKSSILLFEQASAGPGLNIIFVRVFIPLEFIVRVSTISVRVSMFLVWIFFTFVWASTFPTGLYHLNVGLHPFIADLYHFRTWEPVSVILVRVSINIPLHLCQPLHHNHTKRAHVYPWTTEPTANLSEHDFAT